MVSRLADRRLWVFQATALLLAGLLARLAWLGTAPGISGDEADVWARLHDFIHGLPVSWECPTGKSISPLYLLTLFPFEISLPTSFLTLRAPGVIFGLLTPLLCYFLGRRLLGTKVALLSAIVVFCLPMHLVYSRLFIEQSLMGLTVLLCLYYALQGRSLGMIGWYAAALILHPVNVFVTPMAFAAYFYHLYFESGAGVPERRLKTAALMLIAVVGVAAIVAYVPADAFSHTLNNLKSISSFPTFLFLFTRIFSGVIPVEDVAGALPDPIRYGLDALFIFLVFAGAVAGSRAFIRKRDCKALVLFGSWFFSLFVFYAVGGFIGVRPGLQRHSLFLMIPTVWVLVLCWKAVVSDKWLARGVSAVAWVQVILFGYFFLWHFHQTGGTSHRLYQSASVEPKSQIYQWLEKETSGQQTRVLAEDWWVFHPVRYLAQEDTHLEIAMMYHLNQGLPWPRVREFFAPGGYIIAWSGGQLEQLVRENYGLRAREEVSIENQRHQPLLKVWKIPASSELVRPLG